VKQYPLPGTSTELDVVKAVIFILVVEAEGPMRFACREALLPRIGPSARTARASG